MDQQQWTLEQAHLAQTLETVTQERRKVEIALGMADGNDRLVMVNDDQSGDAIVQLQITRNNLQNLHQLRLSSRSPYFARLDFTPAAGTPPLGGMRAGVNAPVYIGRWGVLKTPEYQVAVHDWRSPVANLYYSGQVGQVKYDAPDGAVHGEMTLKRMFTIEDAKLVSMQDTGVVGQEKFLTDALSQVTTARLREVVTTIQAEQNTVIRYDPMKPLCVQGVAGSGKTTIALHRAAWMLYRLQKTLRPEQMLILAPNPLFLSYISRVLPDLGVDKVHQLTFEQLCQKLLEKRMPKLCAQDRLSERLGMIKAERDALDDILRRKGALNSLLIAIGGQSRAADGIDLGIIFFGFACKLAIEALIGAGIAKTVGLGFGDGETVDDPALGRHRDADHDILTGCGVIFVAALDAVAGTLGLHHKVSGRGLLCGDDGLLQIGVSRDVDFLKNSGPDLCHRIGDGLCVLHALGDHRAVGQDTDKLLAHDEDVTRSVVSGVNGICTLHHFH